MTSSRPNILLIITDQQRGDCLSLAAQLAHRPEGFSHNGQLVAGQPHRVFVPGKGPQIPWGDVGR